MKRKLLILFLTCVVGWLHPATAQTTFNFDSYSAGTTVESIDGWRSVVGNGNTAPLWQISPDVSSLPSILQPTYGNMYKGVDNTLALVSMSVDFIKYFNGDPNYSFIANNYFVTEDKYYITSESSISWYVKRAQGSQTEYYEVVVSEDGNTWTEVFFEDVSSSTMVNKTVSLEEYAEKELYLGFRHYRNPVNTSASALVIDNITISATEPEPTDDLTVTVTHSPEIVYPGTEVTLEASATGGSDSYTSYEWACTSHTLQGTEFWGSGNEYTFMPTSIGDYTFTCTVTDSESNTATSDPVTVTVTEESESAIDLNKQYRIKDVSTSQRYLNIYQITSANTGGKSGVNVATSAESDWQIFTIEDTGNGTYYFRSADGYYIACLSGWMVSAYGTTTSQATALEMVDTGAGNGTFYIQNPDGYFKVENVGGTYYPFSNGNTSDRATWVLEEYVLPSLEITSAYASKSEVYTGETVTLTASATGGSGNYTYSWTCTQGNPVATDFYNTNQAVATFKPTSAGNYRFACTVNDGTSSDTSDEIEVVVDERPELTFPYVLEIGDGTITSAQNQDAQYLPTNTYYGNTISHQLYLSSEIEEQMLLPQDGDYYIKSIAFKRSSLGITANREIQIYLKNTDVTVLSSTLEAMTEADLCFDGVTKFEQNTDGWSVINFTTPFKYEVGKNILVCFNDKTNSYENYTSFYSTTTNNLSVSLFRDNTVYDATKSINGATVRTCRNNIQFTFDNNDYVPLSVQILGDNKLCENSDVQLTASAAGGTKNYTYAWEIVSGGGSLDDTTAVNPTFTPEAVELGTVYNEVILKCTVKDDGTEESSSVITLNVYDTPELELQDSYFVINGETITLEILYDADYMQVSCPGYPNSTQEYKNFVSDDIDTIVYSFTPTENVELTFKVVNTETYSTVIWDYLCSTEKTIAVVVYGATEQPQEAYIGGDNYLDNTTKLPIRTDWGYSISQQIYTAEELMNKGIEDKATISSIAFYGPEINTTSRTLEVYIINTDQTSFNGHDESGESAAPLADDFVNMTGEANFSGTVEFAANVWANIELTTPFEYEEGKNILVCINDVTGTDGGVNRYYTYSTSEIRSISMYTFGGAYNAANISTDNSYTTNGNLRYNNYVRFIYTPYAGDPTLKAKITADTTSICDGEDGNRFYLKAYKVQNATYAWYNSDGDQIGVGEEFVYSNLDEGTYPVKLITSQIQANASVLTAETTINLTINPIPDADLVMGTNGYGFVDEPIGFTTTEEPINGTSYTIDVYEGVLPIHYFSIEAEHTFDYYGTYNYTVTAALNGCESESTNSVIIYPAASFIAEDACEDQEVVFTNKTINLDDDYWNFGEGEGFVWDFGDGTVVASNDTTVTHTYDADSTYQVTLTVTKSGISNAFNHDVTVNPLPEADFEWDKVIVKEDITFTPSGAASYSWTINGVEPAEGEVDNDGVLTHRFEETGEYTIGLTATSFGCSVYVEKDITVADKASEPVVMQDGVAVEAIDMGNRPVESWMYPIDLVVVPDGSTDMHIDSITIVDRMDDGLGGWIELNYAKLTSVVKNVTVKPGESIDIQLTHDLINETLNKDLFGSDMGANLGIPQTEAQMIINYGNNQVKVINISYNAYSPLEGDVWEYPHNVTFNNGSYTNNTITPQRTYLLEGATSAHNDAVYKLTFTEATQLTATVNGDNPLAYVYDDEFGDEPGPGLTNYVGYQAPYVPPFEGFSFTLENEPSFNAGNTEGTGWKTDSKGGSSDMYADLDWGGTYPYPRYFLSNQSDGENELNYFITTDKYYISETARLSMSTWVSASSMKYYVFVSEDGYEFTTVQEGVVSSKTAATVDVDLSDYVGEYYVGIMHVGAESSGGSGNFYLDDITLYEPETRATRANDEPTLNIMLEEGTYYLVAAAANNDFSVTINAETLTAPEKAGDPRPRDKANISTDLDQLTWSFGKFTEEYQLLFGTSNPPTEELVEWNNDLETASCELNPPLMSNTVYYWQVNAKNHIISDITAGDVWRFATPFDAPTVELSSYEIEVGGYSTLSWTAPEAVTPTGYNIYIDDEKVNETLLANTTSEYEISGLGYKAEAYEIEVEAVYTIDNWDIKSSSVKELLVRGYATVEGYVYEQDEVTPIGGVTVRFGEETFTTEDDGYFTGVVFAGTYQATAKKAGYDKVTTEVNAVYNDVTTVTFVLPFTLGMAENVVAVENGEQTAVDVTWALGSEGGPMFEDFENGFTYKWETSEEYPWEVVPNGYEEGSAGYELYGGYCVKSTNSDYDYDQLTGGYKEDNDYPLQNTTSYLQLTAHIPFDGKIKFYYKLEADDYAGDKGLFYIDDDSYTILGAGGFTNWGTTTYFEYDVTAGEHIFKWEYKKDDGWYYGTDAFYIDNISFYESTNLYNVYRKDILTENSEELLAEDLTVQELADTEWANEDFADGIYQWGVSVEYNEPAGDLLNEDFEGFEEPETFLEGWSKYTAEAEDSYYPNHQWYVGEENEYQKLAYGNEGYSAFVSPLPGESVFYFVTPALNTSREATLEFDYIIPCFDEVEFPNDFSKFKVAYSTSQTGPWTDLIAFDKTSVENWTHAIVEELPLEKELYIAFIHQNVENYGQGIGLDNVRIHRVAVSGTSNIAWSNLIGKGNELIVDGSWDDENNWSREIVPEEDDVAIIKAAGTVDDVDAAAKAVLVDNGTLTIGESGVLTASTVIDSVAADLTINAGGQLVHSNAGVMATFVKDITAYTDDKNGWYTISSPLATNVNASDVTNLLYGNFDLYRYDEPTHYWENYEDDVDAEGPDNTDWDNHGAVIEQGRGYLYANADPTRLSFVGELNTTAVSRTLSAKSNDILTGFNLLGNPFAHDIYKGVAFAKGNELRPGYYTLDNAGAWLPLTEDDAIKSGAGFLVQTDVDATQINIDKVNAAPTSKSAEAMLAVAVVNDRYEDVAYVTFNEGLGLEKIGHMNENIPMVYVPSNFNSFAIATVEEDVTEVPVNFEAMTMGEYTIGVKAENCEYKVMTLVDNLTGVETNLLKDSYTFMATTTDDPDRFLIKLSKENSDVEDNSFIYINNGELIFDNLSNDAIINVFDVLGRNVATFNNCGDTTFRVSTDLFADGVYMVRLIEGNNVKVQKMVIE